MKREKTSILTLIALGGSLFSMHFGATSMIWPMTWGKDSGTSFAVAFLGIYLTSVFIPLLGYISLAKGEGTFYQLSKRISPTFAKIFCNLTIIVLGPLFVIPRMSAAAWDAFLQITKYESSSMISLIIFTTIYYMVVYWFISSKDSIMDRLSKILLPILLITVTGVFAKGLLNPLSLKGAKVYSEPAFIYGFVEGYATMELPCALMFGGIIINSLKSKNVSKDKLNKYLIIVGIIGTCILALSHFLHMAIGANTDGLYENLRYSALYAEVVVQLWGTLGGIIFNIGLLFGALTTAVGLTAATSSFYEETSKGRIKYKNAAITTAALSGVVSILGLESIIVVTAPILNIIYPPAIVLTVCYALIKNVWKNERKLRAMKVAVLVSMGFGTIDGVIGYAHLLNINIQNFEHIFKTLPLSNFGLSWIIFSILGFFIGYFMKKEKKINLCN